MYENTNARELATRVVMMPRDTNGQGNIFGGVILSHIDLAGAVVARLACGRRRTKRIVTRAMDSVEFSKPVLVNDILTCYGTITFIGHTSIGVHVDVEVDRAGIIIPVTDADVVYVAVNSRGKPTPVGCKGSCGSLAGSSSGGRRRKARSAQSAVQQRLIESPAYCSFGGERVLALKKVMMPFETNGMGNIFGGVLLSHMDQAGAYVARRACASKFIERCVTAAMDKVEFKQPVLVNDVLSCWGTVTRIGKTSISVHVEVEADRAGSIIPVTSADLVFVALDRRGKPAPVTCSADSSCHDRPSQDPCAS